MSDQRIVGFIRDSLGRGLGRNEIEAALVQKGWNQAQISEAFADAGKNNVSSVVKAGSGGKTLYVVVGVLMLIFVVVGAVVFLWPTEEGCVSSRDCGSGYDCVGGECFLSVEEEEEEDIIPAEEEEEEEPECYYDLDCADGYECSSGSCVKLTVTTTPAATTNETTTATSGDPNYLVDYVKFGSMSMSTLNFYVNISNDEDSSSSESIYLYCDVENNVSSYVYTGENSEVGPDSLESSVETCSVSINGTDLYSTLLTKSPIMLTVNATVDYYDDVTEIDEDDNSLVTKIELFKENVAFSLPSVVCSGDAGCVSLLGSGYVCTSGYCAVPVATTTTADLGGACSSTVACVSPYTCVDDICVECDDDTDCTTTGEICLSNVCAVPECSDLIDNDGDLKIDYVSDGSGDSGCLGIKDNTEKSCVDAKCGAYVCDTTLDACYTSCVDLSQCSLDAFTCSNNVCEYPVEVCDDGIDNDHNGKIDYYGGCDIDKDLKIDYVLGCLEDTVQYPARLSDFSSFNLVTLCSSESTFGWYIVDDTLDVNGFYDEGLTCKAGGDIEGMYFGVEDSSVCSKLGAEELVEVTIEEDEVEVCDDYIDNDGDGFIDSTGGCDKDGDLKIDYVCGCYDSSSSLFLRYGNGTKVPCDDDSLGCQNLGTGRLIPDYCGSGKLSGGVYYKNDSDCDAESFELIEGVIGGVAGGDEEEVVYECNDLEDNDDDELVDYYGVCSYKGATSVISCSEILGKLSTNNRNSYAVKCEAGCVKSYDGVHYDYDSDCLSETGDSESVVLAPLAAAELEENIFSKIWRFIIESNPVIEMFKKL